MKIVIAEDDALSRRVLEDALRSLDFQVSAFADGTEAWEHQRLDPAQVVITDWMMPGLDGLELCKKVREGPPDGSYVYLILLTGRVSRADRLAALQAGADDFLTKPYDTAELIARLHVARRIITMSEQLRSRTAELERMHSELERRNVLLAEMASRDGLTGLKNHRFFREALEEQFAIARDRGLPLSLVMLDVDQFKAYNDAFGHPAGDEVLREVSKILLDCVQEQDIVARYGGEEFAILLPGANIQAGRSLGERARAAIERHAWPRRPVTISLGISTMSPRHTWAATIIEQADRALYQSKADGRNRSTHACERPTNLVGRLPEVELVEDPRWRSGSGEYSPATA